MKNLSSCVFSPVLCIVLALFIFSGCGKGYKGEKLHPVSITITDAGNPVESAAVIMVRQGGEFVNVSGLTDSSGVALMKVDTEWNGAPEGSYIVKISKNSPIPHELSPEEISQLGLKEREEYDSKIADKIKNMKPAVPSIVNGDDSPLKIEVKPENNTVTFDISEYWQN